MFEGIEGEILGDFGLAHGAAGGIEIDLRSCLGDAATLSHRGIFGRPHR